jgi:hypothetical protein
MSALQRRPRLATRRFWRARGDHRRLPRRTGRSDARRAPPGARAVAEALEFRGDPERDGAFRAALIK